MRYKLAVFFLLTFLFFSNSVHATDLLTRLEARYADLKSWQADFTQTSYVAVLEQNLSKEGKIAALRPDKIRIDYFSDPQKTYVVNGKTLWVMDPVGANHDSPVVQEYKNANAMLSPEALGFLKGLADLSALFVVTKKELSPPANLGMTDKSLMQLTLVPRDVDSAITALMLGVDANTLTLKEAMLFNDSGNVTHYEFQNTVFDAVLNAQDFKKPK